MRRGMALPLTQRGRSRIYTIVLNYWTWQSPGGPLLGAFGSSLPGGSSKILTNITSDLLTDLTTAGDLTVGDPQHHHQVTHGRLGGARLAQV